MGGEISHLATDNDILRDMRAQGFSSETQDVLVKNAREADAVADNHKNEYGNGVSVKFIVTMISHSYSLGYLDGYILNGKSFGSDYTKFPAHVTPLGSVGGFHAKANSEANGSFGCVQYTIQDAVGGVHGYVAIAWAQPYSEGSFRYHVGVRSMPFKMECLARNCAAACEDQDDIGDTHLGRKFRVTASKKSSSTSLLHVVVADTSFNGQVREDGCP